jgi:hypothetical protein
LILKQLLKTLVVVLVLGLVLTPSTTFGSSSELNEKIELATFIKNNEKKIRERMDHLKIKKNIQNKLIDKMKSGELPDSEKPHDIEIDIKPNEIKSITYPDGSVETFSFIDVNEGALEKCGSGYCTYDRTVAREGLLTSGKFKCRYTNVQKAYDKIDSVWDPYVSGKGGVATRTDFGIKKKREDSSSWARAILEWKFDAVGGTGSITHLLRIFVGGDTYKISYQNG